MDLKTYIVIIRYYNTRETVQNFSTDLESAKLQTDLYRNNPRTKRAVIDASVYEVQTCWSPDLSNANAILTKVY